MKSRCLKRTTIRILCALLLMAFCMAQISGTARAQVPQTSCSEIWDMPITVTDQNLNSRTLVFGQGLLATDDRDDCDQLAPPPPPLGAFEAKISYLNIDYYKEYSRANIPGTVTWWIKYQASTATPPAVQTITLSWDSAALPGAGTWTLRYYDVNGDPVNVDMRAVSSVQVTNFDIPQARITYATTRCTWTAITSGNWNETSTWNTNCPGGVPTNTDDDILIPGNISVDFNNSATTIESLTIGAHGHLTFSNTNLLTVSDNAFVRGGTLNLGDNGNLTVNGTLTNLGVMQQTKDINANATENFLNIGGYVGLTLTSHATSLGSTTVGIIGGQICDTDNTSVYRCFTITPGQSVIDAEIVFYYALNELHTSACSSMAAWRSTGERSWAEAGTTLVSRSCASEPYSVSYTGATIVDTGSYFSLRSSSSPTAISLHTFNATSTRSSYTILLTVGLIGLALLSGIAIWRVSGERKKSL